MPSLCIFHRKSFLAGDDLKPAVVISLYLRLAQSTLFLGPILARIAYDSRQAGGFSTFLLHDRSHDEACSNTHIFSVLLSCYVLASVVYNVCAALLECRIAQVSSRGCPTNTEPRNTKVGGLMEIKLAYYSVVLFAIWCVGISAIALVHAYNRCTRAILEGDTNDDAPTRFHYWWVGWFFLMFTQATEFGFSWLHLRHLFRAPVVGAEVTWSARERIYELNRPAEEKQWSERCESFCQCFSILSCFMCGGHDVMTGAADFSHLAQTLADFFETRGLLDISLSDVLMGLVVVRRLQKIKAYQVRHHVLNAIASATSGQDGDNGIDANCDAKYEKTSEIDTESLDELENNVEQPVEGGGRRRQSIIRLNSEGQYYESMREILDRDNTDDMAALEEGARYAKYALAIYTWAFYLYTHPMTGVTRLATASLCSRCSSFLRMGGRTLEHSEHDQAGDIPKKFQDGPHRIDGDGCCQWNKHGLLLTVGLKDSELLYAQLKSGFADTPYCILLDHERNSIVLAVRGSLSVEDFATDVMIEPKSMEEVGREFGFDAEGQYCHGGMLTCARNVYRDLQRHGLLEQLLIGESALYPNYKLVVVGHSLGAAAGTILSYMLRSKIPNVRCLNYCPVGCTLTWELATGCSEWCTSFVLDSDLVPRLTIDTLERMRDEVLDVIGRVKVPKMEVVRQARSKTGMWKVKLSSPEGSIDGDALRESIRETLYDPDEVPASEYQERLSFFKEIQEGRRLSREWRSVKLYPPGKIMHIIKTGETKTCAQGCAKSITCATTNLGFHYSPVWVKNGDLNELAVDPRMALDHFPNRITAVLERVAADHDL